MRVLRYDVPAGHCAVEKIEQAIMPVETVEFDIDADLSAKMMSDDGYVDIRLIPRSNAFKRVSGSFVLARSTDEDDYESWQELYRFNLLNEVPNRLLWQDFTVQ